MRDKHFSPKSSDNRSLSRYSGLGNGIMSFYLDKPAHELCGPRVRVNQGTVPLGSEDIRISAAVAWQRSC